MRILKYLSLVGLLAVANVALANPNYEHTLPQQIKCMSTTADTCVLPSRFFKATAEGDLHGTIEPGIYYFDVASAQTGTSAHPRPYQPSYIKELLGYSLYYFYKNNNGKSLMVITPYQSTLTASIGRGLWIANSNGYYQCSNSAADCPFTAPYI